jgi:transposase
MVPHRRFFMAYISGENRDQFTLLPQSLDEYVDDENPVRLIEAFVNSLDMELCGFRRHKPAATGTPGYDPRDLIKLLIYAYFIKIRSSRKIMKEAERNVEVMWLIRKLTPDFRTISDFRKDNVQALKAVFREWNLFCEKLGLFKLDFVSIDGSKFKAVNSKDRNFTLSKLDDRIKRIDNHIDEYLSLLDRADEEETDERKFTKEELAEKIKDLLDRRDEYGTYQKELERTNQSQKSLTDPESRLMKFKNGFEVGYNVQTAVDSDSHMIAEFTVTNQATDHGLIGDVAESVREAFGKKEAILETAADQGYLELADIADCLERGIIPNVNSGEAGGTVELVLDFEPVEITEEQMKSIAPDDIKECLRAGVIPDVYEGVIEKLDVHEKRCMLANGAGTTAWQKPVAEMIERAKDGYFVRDMERGLVYCPAGCILRAKTSRKDGSIRYYNKLACADCKKKCTTSKWKEIDFSLGKIEVKSKISKMPGTTKIQGRHKRKMVKVKQVEIVFRPDQKKLDRRMSLSEHPFGTVKRWHDGSYFLLKGIDKTTGELSLSFLIYNIKRAISLLGMKKIMAELG